MEENALIRLFLEQLPTNEERVHPFFIADAETIDIAGNRVLFTIDGFDDEDHFQMKDPFALGHNLAAGTVSDVFASGGSVRYFAHSVTVSSSWNADFIRELSRGIAEVISSCGARFAGGDIGISDRWHYTGVAIGEAPRMLTRTGARAGDRLYVSGEIGAGNFMAAAAVLAVDGETAALLRSDTVRFPVRRQEAALIARHASASIDTSDGLLRALNIIAELNHTGYRIGPLPYYSPALRLVEKTGLPEALLAAGQCGEYELLCCIPETAEEAFLRDAGEAGLHFHAIGQITDHGVATIESGGRTLDMSDLALEARQFDDHQKYVQALTAYFHRKETP